MAMEPYAAPYEEPRKKKPKAYGGDEPDDPEAYGDFDYSVSGQSGTAKPPGDFVETGGVTGGSAANQATAAPQPADVGHDGVYNGLNREQWRDKWMSSGVSDLDGLKQFLAANGGTLISDNGTVLTPYGETLDIGANARTGHLTPAWTQVGGEGAGASDLAALIASGGGGGASSYGGVTGGVPASGAPNSDLAALIAQAAAPIDVEGDPAVAAFRRSLSRDYAKRRADLAEESGYSGSGNLEGRQRQLAEDEAESVAGYAGSRAAQIQQLRQNQEQFLRSLGLSYAQLGQQGEQFFAQLSQNRDLALRSLGLEYDRLSAAQKQALDQLTYMYDQLEVNANRDALLAALGAYS